MAGFDRFVQTSWAYAVLALLVLACAIPGVTSMPVLDRDEARFTQATAQMLETGDFVVIKFHEGLRNKKPAGIHWLQSAAVSASSSAHAREISSYRIASLLGAVVAAMAAMWAGAALFGRRAAFLGAALLGTSLLLTTEAHIAKTDAVLCGLVTLAMAALARLRTGGGKMDAILFWVSIGAGVMVKGPVAPMVAGLALVALGLWERRWAWMRPLTYWLGLSLFAIITVPWYVAVEIATSGAFLREAAGVDLGQKIVGAAEGHNGPFGMHLAVLPLLFWPGTLLLVPGLWLALKHLRPYRPGAATPPAFSDPMQQAAYAAAVDGDRREGDAWRFLIAWALPTWLVFEIAPTKLIHYALPAYPALALMAGAALDRWMANGEAPRGRWISLLLFAGAGSLLAIAVTPGALTAVRAEEAGGFAFPLNERAAFEWAQAYAQAGAGIWPALLIAAATLATIYFAVSRKPAPLLISLAACAFAVGIAYRSMVLPKQSWMLASEASVAALAEICALPEGTAAASKTGCTAKGPKRVQAIAFAEPSFVFALGGLIVLPPKSTAKIPRVEEDSRPAWLINVAEEEGRAALQKLATDAAAADRCMRFARRLAWNYSNDEASELVAVVVEPGGCVDEPSAAP